MMTTTDAERCPPCGSPVTVVSGDEGTSHYEPFTAAGWARMTANLIRRIDALKAQNTRLLGDNAALLQALDRERQTFPSEGIFEVHHGGGGKAYMRIAKLGEVPEPYVFAAVARHTAAVAQAIVEARKSYAEITGWIPSPMTEAEAVVRALATAEGVTS